MVFTEVQSVKVDTLVGDVLKGDRLALARALTQVENDTPTGQIILNQLFPHTGKAHLIGVTGSPGAGKSSLANQLARHFRKPIGGEAPRKVAIVAVDPTSPFSGGALLGDRIRMRDLSGDSGIFIHSMASRGALGGLSLTTSGIVQVFDAAGFEVILIETVGAGQSEVDVARLAHTTLVVEAPGMGDDIQAIKAGILEIADILVINKADRPGADHTERIYKAMVEMAYPGGSSSWDMNHHAACDLEPVDGEIMQEKIWIPQVVRTVANQDQGVGDLVELIHSHLHYLKASGEWKRRETQRIENELQNLVKQKLMVAWRASLDPVVYQQAVEDLLARKRSPRDAVRDLTG